MNPIIIVVTILYILLGWLAGIMINHAADILPKRETVWQTLRCVNCHTPHQTYSALIAWLTGRQLCEQCGQPRHPNPRAIIVELVGPLIFMVLLARSGLSLELAINTCYTVILILVTVTDLEHKLIFNVVMLPAILLAILLAFITPLDGYWSFANNCRSLILHFFNLFLTPPDAFWQVALLGGATGFFLSYLAFILGTLTYGPGALGTGDVTLSVFLGLILGLPYILLTLVLAVFLGAIVPVLLLLSRQISRRSYIPYGPFLTISGWFMLVWGNQIWQYFYC